jgi:hypothetical protein
MEASDYRQRITQAVLQHLQDLLKRAKVMKNREEEDLSVAKAEEMYVELRDRPSYSIPPGVVLAKWKVTRKEIVDLPVSAARPVHVATGKNFYRTAWAEFAISEDAAAVVVGFKLSPNWGHGDVYQVVTDEGQRISLRWMQPAWEL